MRQVPWLERVSAVPHEWVGTPGQGQGQAQMWVLVLVLVLVREGMLTLAQIAGGRRVGAHTVEEDSQGLVHTLEEGVGEGPCIHGWEMEDGKRLRRVGHGGEAHSVEGLQT